MALPHIASSLKQLRAAFTRFDADADGSLTHHELAALLRCVGLRPTHAQVSALLSAVDSNGNGSVEFAELAAAVMPVVMERMLLDRERLMGLFRSFDRDGNGYITAADLALSMARMGQPLTFPELAEMMREADTDGDGVISFPEFASIMSKLSAVFTRFNVDAVGSLITGNHELATLCCDSLRPTHTQVHVLLSAVDSKGNNIFEFAELAAAVIPVIMERMLLLDREQLMGLFRSFDRDGKGYITAAELALSLSRMGHPITFRELADLMRVADGDGITSFSEFAYVMAKVSAIRAT